MKIYVLAEYLQKRIIPFNTKYFDLDFAKKLKLLKNY